MWALRSAGMSERADLIPDAQRVEDMTIDHPNTERGARVGVVRTIELGADQRFEELIERAGEIDLGLVVEREARASQRELGRNRSNCGHRVRGPCRVIACT